ncbi:MAG: ribonuclease P protein component [Myxococcota bacterium]
MRLRRRRDFLAVQQSGTAIHGKHFLAVVARYATQPGNSSSGRVGITVSKKVGNAVVRNRIKRLVREYARHNANAFAGWDVVIIAKRGAAGLTGYGAVHDALEPLCKRIGRRGRSKARSRQPRC